MNTLRKIDRVLNAIRIVALVVILLATIIMCTTNIVLRYIVRGNPHFRPFPWVNELMQMAAIWIAFLAAGLGVKSGSHISLESFLKEHLNAKVALVLKKIAQVIVLVTLAILIVYGIKTTIFQKNSYLQNINISFAWFYAAIPVGCFYLFYDYLLIFIFGSYPFKKEDKSKVVSGSF